MVSKNYYGTSSENVIWQEIPFKNASWKYTYRMYILPIFNVLARSQIFYMYIFFVIGKVAHFNIVHGCIVQVLNATEKHGVCNNDNIWRNPQH